MKGRDEYDTLQEVMKEIMDHMKYSGDELEERLGRKKPKVEMVVAEGKMPKEAMEKMEEKMGMDLDDDQEMGEPMEHKAKVMAKYAENKMKDEDDKDGEDISPKEMLKKRLMKLRA